MSILEPVIQNLIVLNLSNFAFSNWGVLARGEKLTNLLLESSSRKTLVDEHLDPFIQLAPQLKFFSLVHVNVSSKFLQIIRGFNNLQVLNLSHMPMHPILADEVLKEIEGNRSLLTHLTELNLSDTNISDARYLGSLVNRSTALRYMNLSDCPLLPSDMDDFNELCAEREVSVVQRYTLY